MGFHQQIRTAHGPSRRRHVYIVGLALLDRQGLS
jgi:hypothetical protein